MKDAVWRVVAHSWAETSVLDKDGNQVCLLSIEDEATEETQDALEKRTAERANLIAAAPIMLATLMAMREVYSETPISAWTHAINAAIAQAHGKPTP